MSTTKIETIVIEWEYDKHGRMVKETKIISTQEITK